MPGNIVSVKAMHKSLTSKYKTVTNVSVDNMYLFKSIWTDLDYLNELWKSQHNS